jgi:hypothetical protein
LLGSWQQANSIKVKAYIFVRSPRRSHLRRLFANVLIEQILNICYLGIPHAMIAPTVTLIVSDLSSTTRATNEQKLQ